MYVGRFEVGLRGVATLCLLFLQKWVPVVLFFLLWQQCMYVYGYLVSCRGDNFDSSSSGFLPFLGFSVMTVCELGNDNSMCSCSIKKATNSRGNLGKRLFLSQNRTGQNRTRSKSEVDVCVL